MDYRKYRAGLLEKLACAAVGAGAAGMAAWLFYRSVWGMLLFPAAYLVCVKKYCALQMKKRKEQLLMEFKDAMQSASAALLAGYSVENAWRETEKELLELPGAKGFMAAEVRWMNEGVRMNEPLEDCCFRLRREAGVRRSRVLRRYSRLQSGAAETLSTLCRRRYKNSRGGLKSKGKWQPCLQESVWRGGLWK